MENVNKIVEQYIERIYAYVKKRVANEADVEDITQEIALNLYRALCVKEVDNVEGFVWVVVKNTLTNFYRGNAKTRYNISIEDGNIDFADGKESALETLIYQENCQRIQEEIAYLSKIQRKVLILYYYEEKKQSEIAQILDIPLGTVKWHLNVAKAEVKKGMEKMRNRGELKFNPITFAQVGFSGGVGTVGYPINFVRSALSQNILYCIQTEALTVEKIADLLNVSPVFVESELAYLEEYQLVIRQGKQYFCNILIEETTEEGIKATDRMYRTVTGKIANTLFDEMVQRGYLHSDDIIGPKDDNFRMWSLMFYLLATSENGILKKISFQEAATIRADGGENIIIASVEDETIEKPALWNEYFCGPCWNENKEVIIWLIDGEWTERRVTEHYGGTKIEPELRILKRFADGKQLSVEEYTLMLEKGYIRKNGEDFELAIVALKDGETKEKLLSLASQIKNEVLKEHEKLLEEYRNEVLGSDRLPKHLRVQREFLNQHLFGADGIFMRYIKDALVDSGRLKALSEEQKKSVSQILILK
ncbi:MAG: sigma-70 family RNA polymerase sigma factor [Eubacterium sp.]|nr:sigma-70 family RNA polymerase sigma factor [Eubacterium sp.]